MTRFLQDILRQPDEVAAGDRAPQRGRGRGSWWNPLLIPCAALVTSTLLELAPVGMRRWGQDRYFIAADGRFTCWIGGIAAIQQDPSAGG